MNSEVTPYDNRHIRVFVSSTFIDMQADRDVLIKEVFPRLRKLCEERGVIWSEVDLRWGITAEEFHEGKLIPTILQEIKNCRPYFISLLGERYGYVPGPNQIPKEILHQHKVICKHQDRSITELEILVGVLETQGIIAKAFFYLRDPAFLNSLSEQERTLFEGGLPSESFNQLSREEQSEELRKQQISRKKLVRLKKRILRRGEHVSNYHMPADLRELVYEDFRSLIETLYPQNEVPDRFAVMSRDHYQFARKKGWLFHDYDSYLSKIRGSISRGNGLVEVIGPSGCGKSAILAAYLLNKADHEDIICHFSGATSSSSNIRNLLTRVIVETGRLQDREPAIPDNIDDLVQLFRQSLERVSHSGKTVTILLDALNELSEQYQPDELYWLPAVTPPNVAIIVSATPGNISTRLSEMGVRIIEVSPMDATSRTDLVVSYLRHYAKKLNQEQLNLIVSHPMAGNPHFLCTVLNEIRLLGVYEQLPNEIEKLLSCSDHVELYSKVFHRIENDFEGVIPGVVRKTLTYLLCSRNGLSESELIQMLAPAGMERLPNVYWSPVWLAIESYVVAVSGRYTFAHDSARASIKSTYMCNEVLKAAVHNAIADYFAWQSEEISDRQVEEYPWQLVQAKRWDKLEIVIKDPVYFSKAFSERKYDLLSFWESLEANTQVCIKTSLQKLARQQAGNSLLQEKITLFLSDKGYFRESVKIGMSLLQRWDVKSDPRKYASLVDSLAQAGLNPGSSIMKTIMKRLKEIIPLCRKEGYSKELGDAYINYGYGLDNLHQSDAAIEYYRKAANVARKIGDNEMLWIALNNQSVTYMNQSRNIKAQKLVEECLRIARVTGDPEALAISHLNLGWLYVEAGKLRNAYGCFVRYRESNVLWGAKDGIAFGLLSEGYILLETGRIDEAEVKLRESARIGREIGNKEYYPFAEGLLGYCEWLKGNHGEGRKAIANAIKIYLKEEYYDYVIELQAIYGMMLHYSGKYSLALKVFEKGEQLAKRTGNTSHLSLVLSRKAQLLLKSDSTKSAMRLSTNAVALAKKIRYPKGVLLAELVKTLAKSARKGNNTTNERALQKLMLQAKDLGYELLSREIEPKSRNSYESGYSDNK